MYTVTYNKTFLSGTLTGMTIPQTLTFANEKEATAFIQSLQAKDTGKGIKAVGSRSRFTATEFAITYKIMN